MRWVWREEEEIRYHFDGRVHWESREMFYQQTTADKLDARLTELDLVFRTTREANWSGSHPEPLGNMHFILEVAIKLLPQCTLFIDDSLDLISFGRVGLDSDEASVFMAKKIIPTRLLIAPNPERLVSVEAVGKLSTNRRVNELFVLVFDGPKTVMYMVYKIGIVFQRFANRGRGAARSFFHHSAALTALLTASANADEYCVNPPHSATRSSSSNGSKDEMLVEDTLPD